MFGKLKESAGNAALPKVVDALSAKLVEQTDKLKEMNPDVVRDDETFTEKFSKPALVAVAAMSSGVTSLVPRFEERFSSTMLHVRDELLVLDGERVELVEGFKERLPGVMMTGFKQS